MNLPAKITRDFIRKNREVVFIYGKSLIDQHDSDEGKDICEGEPNTYGITVCRCFDLNENERYFLRKEFDNIKDRIRKDISEIPMNFKNIIVMPGFGEGKSMLQEKTPELYFFVKLALYNSFPGIIYL